MVGPSHELHRTPTTSPPKRVLAGGSIGKNVRVESPLCVATQASRSHRCPTTGQRALAAVSWACDTQVDSPRMHTQAPQNAPASKAATDAERMQLACASAHITTSCICSSSSGASFSAPAGLIAAHTAAARRRAQGGRIAVVLVGEQPRPRAHRCNLAEQAVSPITCDWLFEGLHARPCWPHEHHRRPASTTIRGM